MILRKQKSGISTAVGIAAVVVAIVLVLSAYEVVTVSSKVVTSDIFSTTTVPTTLTTTTPTTLTATSTTTATATTTVPTTVTATTTATATTTSVSTSVSKSTTTATATTTSTSTSTVTAVVLAPIISYSADAYATETTALLNGFSAATGIPVAPVVSGGSNADASTIAAGAPDDVFLSASLSATAPAHLGSLSSNWAIGIAEDQMVVAYSSATLTSSAASSDIAAGQKAASSNATSDWNAFYTALTNGKVLVGISNPTSDPAGYRAWLVLEAAGYLYTGSQTTYANALLAAKANVTASSAANLVAPLQSGQIQFLFIYKSAAVSDGLSYLSLNNHVNLSSPSLNTWYSQFTYTAGGTKNTASAIVIVITVPLSSQNTIEALEFVQYVVNQMSSLSAYGLVIPTTALLYNSVTAPQTLPTAIQLMLTQGLLVTAGPI